MKKILYPFIAAGLVGMSVPSLAVEESVNQICADEAVAREIPDKDYDAFMKQCVARVEAGEAPEVVPLAEKQTTAPQGGGESGQ